jgi:hypothetical protein
MSAQLVAVAGNDARAWNIRADALQRAWRWEAALEANARAQSIDSTRPGSIGQRADIMNAMGRSSEALALVDQGLSLAASRPGRCVSDCLPLSCEHGGGALRGRDFRLRKGSVARRFLAASRLSGRGVRQPRQRDEEPGGKSQVARATPRFLDRRPEVFRFSDVPAYLATDRIPPRCRPAQGRHQRD